MIDLTVPVNLAYFVDAHINDDRLKTLIKTAGLTTNDDFPGCVIL